MKQKDAGASPTNANSPANWGRGFAPGGTYVGPITTGVPWGNVIFAPQAIVKNTFVDVVETPPEEDRFLRRRSASMSDISKSSSEIDSTPHDVGYWLPSLSSTSSGESREQGGSVAVESGAPWLQKHIERKLTQGSNSEGDSAALLPWTQGSTAKKNSGGQERRKSNNPPPPNSRGMLHGGPTGAVRPTEPLDALEQYSGNAGPSEELRNVWNSTAITQAKPSERQEESIQPSRDSDQMQREARVRSAHEELGNRVPLDKIQELDRMGVLELIPRDERNRLTSVGSMEHGSKCTPCAYWFKGICKYSLRCHYCHFIHEGQKSKRLRPSKQTRMRIRRWSSQAEDKADECPQDGVPLHNNAAADEDEGEEEAHWAVGRIDERLATAAKLSTELREVQLRLQQKRARQQANVSGGMLTEEAARIDSLVPAAEASSLETQRGGARLSSDLESTCKKKGFMNANMITRL